MATLNQSVTSNIDPWAVQSKISASDARYALASSLMPINGLSYIDYRSGVLASGDGNNTHLACRVTASSGMTVEVAPGNLIINTTNTGPYMGVIDSTKTLTLAPSSSTGNRIDVVIARIYDDLNANIGSAAGERKLSIEVWTGDVTQGTPAVPTLPLGAGWIPLAYVRVNANVTSITNAVITDARGPGIVARGGMRALYGADSVPGSTEFNAPGAYPGDQRWVHNAGFQHQVYYGSDMGWRGVHNALTFNSNPTSGSGISWYKSANQSVPICSVTIPDPGTPYMIYPTARIEAMFGRGVRADFYIRLDSPTGTIVSWVTADLTYNNGSDKERAFNIAPVMWGNLTGSHTIYLTGTLFEQLASPNPGEYGWGINRAKNKSTLLSTVVYPSTVQPDGSGGWQG